MVREQESANIREQPRKKRSEDDAVNVSMRNDPEKRADHEAYI